MAGPGPLNGVGGALHPERPRSTAIEVDPQEQLTRTAKQATQWYRATDNFQRQVQQLMPELVARQEMRPQAVVSRAVRNAEVDSGAPGSRSPESARADETRAGGSDRFFS